MASLLLSLVWRLVLSWAWLASSRLAVSGCPALWSSASMTMAVSAVLWLVFLLALALLVPPGVGWVVVLLALCGGPSFWLSVLLVASSITMAVCAVLWLVSRSVFVLSVSLGSLVWGRSLDCVGGAVLLLALCWFVPPWLLVLLVATSVAPWVPPVGWGLLKGTSFSPRAAFPGCGCDLAIPVVSTNHGWSAACSFRLAR